VADFRTHREHTLNRRFGGWVGVISRIGLPVWLSLVCVLLPMQLQADLRTPSWYDEGAGVADWHYRVPLVIPATAAVGSTVQFDVDFNSLLSAMNLDISAVAFDANSPRIVRPSGALADEQEFTDRIYAGLLDSAANARGQVRFILDDSIGAGEYYLYFDISANGAKPVNPSQVINGHFEHSSGPLPTRWQTSALNAGGNQNNEVYTTTVTQTTSLAGTCGESASTADSGPNRSGGIATGRRWHLLGYRDNCEDGTGGNEQIRLARNIEVPAGTSAGTLEFYFQVQSYDGISNTSNYDWFEFSVNGANIDHTNLGINNVPAPQLTIDTSRLGRNGYGTTLRDHGWKRAQLNLQPYQGSTIAFRIASRHSSSDNSYRTWIKVDDVVWSLQVAGLGVPEAFGANISLPNDTSVSTASELNFGDTLSLQVDVDASVTGVTANIYDHNAVLVGAAVVLFDDGTHGDAVAADGTWSNDGSDVSNPTYTISGTGPAGSNWLVRVFARDNSVALGGVTNGLVMIPSASTAPEDQSNFYNIDEQTFVVRGAIIALGKTLQTLSDGISVSNPKSIPGAWVRYEVNVANQGPDGLDSNSVVITDQIPVELAVCVSITCAGTDPVEFDDSNSPILTGLTYDYTLNVSYSMDGVDFTYSPIPDAQGFDANVRYVRVTPEGAMNQPAGSDNAEFDLRYVVRVE